MLESLDKRISEEIRNGKIEVSKVSRISELGRPDVTLLQLKNLQSETNRIKDVMAGIPRTV